MTKPLLHASHLAKSYPHPSGALEVLRDVSLTLNEGETVALIGPSGSGKSTLLHVLGLLDTASSGSLTHWGADSTTLTDNARTQIRLRKMGFVYQAHHLMAELTAEENAAMPLLLQGVSRKQALARSREMLERVGLSARARHFPSQLSGGEAQRVAIARALVHKPALLLADEPTGNLDPENARRVLEMMLSACRDHATAALIVTHSHDVASAMNRVLKMHNASVVAA